MKTAARPILQDHPAATASSVVTLETSAFQRASTATMKMIVLMVVMKSAVVSIQKLRDKLLYTCSGEALLFKTRISFQMYGFG